MTNVILNDWLKQQGLEPDLVLGHIRWPRSLGRPNLVPMDHAFTIACYHFTYTDRDDAHPGKNSEHLTSPHQVVHWEGPHDTQYYRISFMTNSREPSGYPEGESDPLKHKNFVDVSLKQEVVWVHDVPALDARHAVVPAQQVFEPPGTHLVLPDFEVRKVS